MANPDTTRDDMNPTNRLSQTTNEWRETVRDLYDDLHFGQDNVFSPGAGTKHPI